MHFMKRKDIEEKAKNILMDHSLMDIPVDPLSVAKALNIKVMNAKFAEPDKSGAVTKRNKIGSIFVNHEDSSTRKRFTIAHELGHLVMHMNDNEDGEYIDNIDNFRSTVNDTAWSEDKRKEWEANLFAAALLMHEDLVRREWKRTKDLSQLAWRFQVSESAMAIRLSSLGITEEYI